MFYCDACAEKNEWPTTEYRSRGPCEMCGKGAICNDLPSRLLPDPQRPAAGPAMRSDDEIHADITACEQRGDERAQWRLVDDVPGLLARAVAAEAGLAAAQAKIAAAMQLHRMGQSRVDHRCQTGHWTQTTKLGGIRQWVEDPCPTAAALGLTVDAPEAK